MKIEQIITVGCSFTAGHDSLASGRAIRDEIVPYPDGTNWQDFSKIETAWPDVLGKLLNLPVLNLGREGASNDCFYIELQKWLNKDLRNWWPDWRTTYIKDNIKKFPTDKKTLVIIGVTSPYRQLIPTSNREEEKILTTKYFFRNENESYVNLNPGNTTQTDYISKNKDSMFSMQAKSYILQEEWYTLISAMQKLDSLKGLLSDRNFSYMFINMLGHTSSFFPYSESKNKQYNFYYDWLKNNCFNGVTPIISYLQEAKQWSQYTDHPSIHGHKYIAQLVENEIRKSLI